MSSRARASRAGRSTQTAAWSANDRSSSVYPDRRRARRAIATSPRLSPDGGASKALTKAALLRPPRLVVAGGLGPFRAAEDRARGAVRLGCAGHIHPGPLLPRAR